MIRQPVIIQPLLNNPSRCSLHAWKIFSKLLQGRKDDRPLGLLLHSQRQLEPASDLHVCLQPLTSSSLDFITYVSIVGPMPFGVAELLPLARLRNLGILEFAEPSDPEASFPRVNDRVMRAWSEQENTFPELQILRLWGYSITERSVQYAARFPTLTLIDIVGAGFDWDKAESYADENGWVMEESSLDDASIILKASGILLHKEPTSKPTYSEEKLVRSYLGQLCEKRDRPVYLGQSLEIPPTLPWKDWQNTRKELVLTTQPPWETELYWLYGLISHLRDGGKTIAKEQDSDMRHVLENMACPSKPMACLRLGFRMDSPRRQLAFQSRRPISRGIFVRTHHPGVDSHVEKAERPESVRRSFKSRKRQKISDVFNTFTCNDAPSVRMRNTHLA